MKCEKCGIDHLNPDQELCANCFEATEIDRAEKLHEEQFHEFHQGLSVTDDECPDFACAWCFESGKIVEADGESGDGICNECEFERSIGEADALYQSMKEG